MKIQYVSSILEMSRGSLENYMKFKIKFTSIQFIIICFYRPVNWKELSLYPGKND